MYKLPSDEAIIARLIEGDEQAFAKLYDKYWEKLFVAGYNRVEDVEVVKEMVQDIFADLWLKRRSLSIQKSIAAYLFGALRHKIIDYIRHKSVRETYIHHISRFHQIQDHSTINQVNLFDLNDALKRAISFLPTRCRQVFEMSRKNHFTNKEIAEQLNISPKTVENQITKALKILRHHLKEYTLLVCLIVELLMRFL